MHQQLVYSIIIIIIRFLIDFILQYAFVTIQSQETYHAKVSNLRTIDCWSYL